MTWSPESKLLKPHTTRRLHPLPSLPHQISPSDLNLSVLTRSGHHSFIVAGISKTSSQSLNVGLCLQSRRSICDPCLVIMRPLTTREWYSIRRRRRDWRNPPLTSVVTNRLPSFSACSGSLFLVVRRHPHLQHRPAVPSILYPRRLSS